MDRVYLTWSMNVLCSGSRFATNDTTRPTA